MCVITLFECYMSTNSTHVLYRRFIPKFIPTFNLSQFTPTFNLSQFILTLNLSQFILTLNLSQFILTINLSQFILNLNLSQNVSQKLGPFRRTAAPELATPTTGVDPQWRRGYKSCRLRFLLFGVTLVSSVFHASYVSASAVQNIKKGT